MSGKKFTIYFSFIALVLIVLIECKKRDDKIIVSGTAYNPQTGTTVSGMEINLSAKTITNGTWNTLFSTIQTQTTDGSGGFSFNFDNMRASEYKLTFNKSGYIINEYFFSPDLVNPGKEYNKTYDVHYEAWMKLFFRNNPPASSSDMIYYQFLKGSAACPNGCNDSLIYLSGADIDTFHVCKLYGSQNAVIKWNYSSTNTNQQHIDTVWIAPNDTTSYYINF